MSARQNFVVVIPRSWEVARNVLAVLRTTIEEWIGSLTLASVQNFATGLSVDQVVRGIGAAEPLPSVSDQEIVVFYPSDPKRGSVLVSHEGVYDLVVLSIGEHAPVLDRLGRIWGLVGSEADAVLAGEELEVEEEHIAALFESRQIPEELDLCDAAIAKLPHPPANLTGRSERNRLPHGGQLLMK